MKKNTTISVATFTILSLLRCLRSGISNYTLPVLFILVISITGSHFIDDADAWKPNTHMYLGNQVLDELCPADAQTGKYFINIDGGVYEVSREIGDAICSYPEHFRAGVIGPDGYPDMLMGQSIVHPDNRCYMDDYSDVQCGEFGSSENDYFAGSLDGWYRNHDLPVRIELSPSEELSNVYCIQVTAQYSNRDDTKSNPACIEVNNVDQNTDVPILTDIILSENDEIRLLWSIQNSPDSWHIEKTENIPIDLLRPELSTKHRLADGTQRSTTIGGLDPNTFYCFQVSAVYSNSPITTSNSACIKTKDVHSPLLPEEPLLTSIGFFDNHVTDRNPDRIDFSWELNANPDGWIYESGPELPIKPSESRSFSDEWFRHVYDYGWEYYRDTNNDHVVRQQVLAFSYGYITHAVGDVWAHTLVNEYARGVFPGFFEMLDDPTKAEIGIRHMVVEDYIGDHTPDTVKEINMPQYEDIIQSDYSEDTYVSDLFIFNERARELGRGDIIEHFMSKFDKWEEKREAGELLATACQNITEPLYDPQGVITSDHYRSLEFDSIQDATSFSRTLPPSDVRIQVNLTLQKISVMNNLNDEREIKIAIDEIICDWDSFWLQRTGDADDRDDIIEGFRAWPAVMHEAAVLFFQYDQPGDGLDHLETFVTSGFSGPSICKMELDDAVCIFIELVDILGIPSLALELFDLGFDEWLIKTATGIDVEELEARYGDLIENPSSYINVESHPVDLASDTSRQLDRIMGITNGHLNSEVRFDEQNFAPAKNTITSTKLLLLGEDNLNNLLCNYRVGAIYGNLIDYDKCPPRLSISTESPDPPCIPLTPENPYITSVTADNSTENPDFGRASTSGTRSDSTTTPCDQIPLTGSGSSLLGKFIQSGGTANIFLNTDKTMYNLVADNQITIEIQVTPVDTSKSIDVTLKRHQYSSTLPSSNGLTLNAGTIFPNEHGAAVLTYPIVGDMRTEHGEWSISAKYLNAEVTLNSILIFSKPSVQEHGPDNAMLGFIRSLDGHQQWRINSTQPGYVEGHQYGEGMPLWVDCSAREKVFRTLYTDWDRSYTSALGFPDDGELSIPSGYSITPLPDSFLEVQGQIELDGNRDDIVVVPSQNTFLVYPDPYSYWYPSDQNQVMTYTHTTPLSHSSGTFEYYIEQRGNSTAHTYYNSNNPSREFTIHYTSSGLCSDDPTEGMLVPDQYHRAHFKVKINSAGVGSVNTLLNSLVPLGTPVYSEEFLKLMDKFNAFWEKYGESILKENFCRETECDPVPSDIFRNHQVLSDVGSKFASDGNIDASSSIFKHALKIAPNDVYVNLAFANALSSNGNYKEAQKYYDQATKISPNNPHVLISISNSLSNQGDFDNAESQIKKILEMQSTNLLANSLLVDISIKKAVSFESNFRSENVIEEYQKAIEYNDVILHVYPENVSANKMMSTLTSMIKSEMAKPLSDTLETSIKVPLWIKNNAGWWAEDMIEDSDFVGGIQFMLQNKIIDIPDLPIGVDNSVSVIPSWIKNNAGWWSDGKISENDFVTGIEFLVGQGIIQVN